MLQLNRKKIYKALSPKLFEIVFFFFIFFLANQMMSCNTSNTFSNDKSTFIFMGDQIQPMMVMVMEKYYTFRLFLLANRFKSINSLMIESTMELAKIFHCFICVCCCRHTWIQFTFACVCVCMYVTFEYEYFLFLVLGCNSRSV